MDTRPCIECFSLKGNLVVPLTVRQLAWKLESHDNETPSTEVANPSWDRATMDWFEDHSESQCLCGNLDLRVLLTATDADFDALLQAMKTPCADSIGWVCYYENTTLLPLEPLPAAQQQRLDRFLWYYQTRHIKEQEFIIGGLYITASTACILNSMTITTLTPTAASKSRANWVTYGPCAREIMPAAMLLGAERGAEAPPRYCCCC